MEGTDKLEGEDEKDEKQSLGEEVPFKKKIGGFRPGSGRKPGKLSQKTIDRLKVLEAMQQRIYRSADKLINSQMNLAEGVSYLYVVRTNKKGFKEKPELITSQLTIEQYLAGDLDGIHDEYYYITTERPDNRALDSLFDRALGKVPNKLEGNGEGGEIVIQITKYGEDTTAL